MSSALLAKLIFIFVVLSVGTGESFGKNTFRLRLHYKNSKTFDQLFERSVSDERQQLKISQCPPPPLTSTVQQRATIIGGGFYYGMHAAGTTIVIPQNVCAENEMLMLTFNDNRDTCLNVLGAFSLKCDAYWREFRFLGYGHSIKMVSCGCGCGCCKDYRTQVKDPHRLLLSPFYPKRLYSEGSIIKMNRQRCVHPQEPVNQRQLEIHYRLSLSDYTNVAQILCARGKWTHHWRDFYKTVTKVNCA